MSPSCSPRWPSSKGVASSTDLKVTNVLTFTDWELDPKLEASAFDLQVPEGVAKVKSLMEMLGGLVCSSGPSPLLGKAAPAVESELLDGGKLDLASYKNKNIVVLDFWGYLVRSVHRSASQDQQGRSAI